MTDLSIILLLNAYHRESYCLQCDGNTKSQRMSGVCVGGSARHWLPVKYRCMFKTATLVYKYLHSGSPSYFQPFLSLSSCSYSTRRGHPDHQYLTVPPFRPSVFKSVKHFDHSFAFDAPKIWNELPHDVRSATSVASSRKKLKTYLFAKAYPP